MRNPYRQLLEVLPQRPLQVGDVLQIANGVAIVELPGGGRLTARGAATVGQRVFVRDGVIEAAAPSLPIEIIEV